MTINLSGLSQNPYLPFNENIKPELNQMITSSISLANSYINNTSNLNECTLFKLTANFESIYKLFAKAIIEEEINNLVNEQKLTQQLCSLISNHFVNLDEVVQESDLKYCVHKFKWLLLVFRHYEYVKLDLLEYLESENNSVSLDREAEIIIRSNTLKYPWEQFCNIIRPLIINFYGPINKLSIHIRSHIYSSNFMLLFLDQTKACPRELVIQVPCHFGNLQKQKTQAMLRNVLGYGDVTPFPQQLNFRLADRSIWEVVKGVRILFKKQYGKFSSEELFRTLKFFDQFYQGNPKSLIEYKNIIKIFNKDEYSQVKTMSRWSFDLPLKEFRFEMNQILSAFKNARAFKIHQIPSCVFPHKLFKMLLKTELLPKSYLKLFCSRSSDSKNIKQISSNVFFGIIYPSLDQSNIKNHFDSICNKQPFNWKNDNTKYHINISDEVIKNAQSFWLEKKITPLNVLENFDLHFLFSRAQIECQELEKNIKKIHLNSNEWKNMFMKWSVDFKFNKMN
ncbi:MAG: hypothetical protein Q8K60_00295 [Parachlamydiaceae bacterium]|nr:hypothetical protein [Parachlamydiaceae bacterium]